MPTRTALATARLDYKQAGPNTFDVEIAVWSRSSVANRPLPDALRA